MSASRASWLGRFTDLFLLWVVLFTVLAYVFPAPFIGMRGAIVPGLGIIMFGMGMSLRFSDFARVMGMPRAVGCGLAGQFFIMPLVAWTVAWLFGFPPELALGMVVVGACPGGTASNVIAYLSRADVALSVSMTACSTLLAVMLTPWFIWFLGGEAIAVDPWALLRSLLQIVLLPVLAGLCVHAWLGRRVERLNMVFPALSVAIIVLVIAVIVAQSRDILAGVALSLGAAVLLHNLLGLSLGYGLAWLCRLPVRARRTVAIEVGMQNSGLGVALATAHFTAPLVALPATVFSVIHNLTGTLLANVWRRRPLG